ncbi:gp28 [Burkholderia phage Bcep176]|nr:gp28 [Burkholderia phage Bcep176]ABA60029.1 gp28 [Burkholderia phage Bcep176]
MNRCSAPSPWPRAAEVKAREMAAR